MNEQDIKDAPKQETHITKGGSKLTIIPKDVMNIGDNIMYVDIKGGYLFVGYAEIGIDVFDIQDGANPKKVGRIDSSYWNDEKNQDGTWGKHSRPSIMFYDFNVNESKVGIMETDNSETKTQCPACKSWYHLKYTTQERLGNLFFFTKFLIEN